MIYKNLCFPACLPSCLSVWLATICLTVCWREGESGVHWCSKRSLGRRDGSWIWPGRMEWVWKVRGEGGTTWTQARKLDFEPDLGPFGFPQLVFTCRHLAILIASFGHLGSFPFIRLLVIELCVLSLVSHQDMWDAPLSHPGTSLKK